ncbi:hypothetical protein LTR29_018334, partial [Friedmanniomyces endolithicus]
MAETKVPSIKAEPTSIDVAVVADEIPVSTERRSRAHRRHVSKWVPENSKVTLVLLFLVATFQAVTNGYDT